ncbi:electron transport complex subunit RsxC [Oscillospiraceae bacterium PP1C4]
MGLLQKTMKGAKIGHFKNTENCQSTAMPIPQEVCISMSQHMGPPCKPVVAKGDAVKVGTLIGDSDAFLSAPIHSSVSGTVTEVAEIVTSNGARTQVVTIKTDGEQTVDENVTVPTIENHVDFVKAIRASGLVGLGGAGFPTHIKMNPKNLSEVDTLVVNAAECEPYITSDYRTIIEHSDDVLDGIAAIKKYVGITQVKIAVENNKPQAIELLRRLTEKDSSIEVVSLKSIYPKGAEKVTVFETTGRVIKEGMLPSDVGVIVNNITSTAFIGRYLKTGMPLVSKCLTVDGGAIAEPKNVIAPIGVHFSDVIAFCGGYKTTPKKMLMGGPMMGIPLFDDAYPVLKNNNALLVFDETQTIVEPEQPCIRCGRCMSACPYQLMPRQIELAANNHDVGMLNKLKVMLCMECGSCSYVCPAKRNLTFSNRLAKQMLRDAAKK